MFAAFEHVSRPWLKLFVTDRGEIFRRLADHIVGRFVAGLEATDMKVPGITPSSGYSINMYSGFSGSCDSSV